MAGLEIAGKRLIVQPASFEAADELQTAIAEALRGSKIDLSGLTGINADNPLETDVSTLSGPAESIIGMALSVITSKRVKTALFVCCETVLFGDDKVNREFFENVDNREFYYPIMVEVVKVNIGPFFKRIASLFGGPMKKFQNFLKSK